MILNAAYSFSDVRYQISSKVGERMRPRDADGKPRPADPPPDIRPISYDVELSFVGYPNKRLLSPGTVLVRLDFPVTFSLFTNVWWMPREVLNSMLHSSDPDASDLRRKWQHSTALPKAAKGTRTQIVEIEITEPVYA
jgi:hypothetical protein